MANDQYPDGLRPSRAAAVAARRRVYAEDTRRAAARALDRYIDSIFGQEYLTGEQKVEVANDCVEALGDYVEARLQHKSQYGAFCGRDECPGPGHLFGPRQQCAGAPSCPAHGAHPHDGMKCLDCQMCFGDHSAGDRVWEDPCPMAYVYVAGAWGWISREAAEREDITHRVCRHERGHAGAHHPGEQGES